MSIGKGIIEIEVTIARLVTYRVKTFLNERPEVARELHQLLVKFMDETNLSPHLRDPRLELKL